MGLLLIGLIILICVITRKCLLALMFRKPGTLLILFIAAAPLFSRCLKPSVFSSCLIKAPLYKAQAPPPQSIVIGQRLQVHVGNIGLFYLALLGGVSD